MRKLCLRTFKCISASGHVEKNVPELLFPGSIKFIIHDAKTWWSGTLAKGSNFNSCIRADAYSSSLMSTLSKTNCRNRNTKFSPQPLNFPRELSKMPLFERILMSLALSHDCAAIGCAKGYVKGPTCIFEIKWNIYAISRPWYQCGISKGQDIAT